MYKYSWIYRRNQRHRPNYFFYEVMLSIAVNLQGMQKIIYQIILQVIYSKKSARVGIDTFNDSELFGWSSIEAGRS